jgi:hypothetical protein
MTKKSRITATPVVGEEARLDFLPTHLHIRWLMMGQNLFFTWLDRLSPDYGGGFWNFYELSNGGFYMAPNASRRFAIAVETNGYEGEVSADAAGIISSLFALNQLANVTGEKHLADAYYDLMDFAAEHAEAPAIFGAID